MRAKAMATMTVTISAGTRKFGRSDCEKVGSAMGVQDSSEGKLLVGGGWLLAIIVGWDVLVLHHVLVHEDGDERGCGDCDEGADDSGEGYAGDQGDEHGEAQEIDAGAHDSGRQVRVFDVDVDEVEDEDAGHLAKRIECRDRAHEGDGDDSSSDGDDIHKAHEDAEQEEVADVQKAEDDGAADAKDEHQKTLAEEPSAHTEFGFFEGDGEAQALFH